MSRRPAHLELTGARGARQRIWECIRKNRNSFSAATIEKATIVEFKTIKSYLQLLERGGFIMPVRECLKLKEWKLYRLARDTGVEAPRLDRDGTVRRPTGNENMWRTMRIMGEFSAAELALRASTAETSVAAATAQAYAHHLASAGYLTVIDPGYRFKRGIGTKPPRYRLLLAKYSGPRPPMIQKVKTVYDPNLGKVVWQEEPDDDAC
jgi:hypothetical protein